MFPFSLWHVAIQKGEVNGYAATIINPGIGWHFTAALLIYLHFFT